MRHVAEAAGSGGLVPSDEVDGVVKNYSRGVAKCCRAREVAGDVPLESVRFNHFNGTEEVVPRGQTSDHDDARLGAGAAG